MKTLENISNIHFWNDAVKKVWHGTMQIRPVPYYTPWIYHNSSLWLISISINGTNWVTIKDKNLWATSVYNPWDTLSQANCWYFYQWGNNHWFPYGGWWTEVTQTVDASAYWPWNYYSSSNRIISNWWDYSLNRNLWWELVKSLDARKWPCPTWYHVPSKDEIQFIYDAIWSFWLSQIPSTYNTYLKMPVSWYVSGSSSYSSYWFVNDTAAWFSCFWQSINWEYKYPYMLKLYVAWGPSYYSSDGAGITSNYPWDCANVRPFANTPTVPDNSRTVLYQVSS